MKNIIFDLGGVLFHRNPESTSSELLDFFSFIANKQMPHFWEEYDRGTQTMDQTIDTLVEIKGCTREKCERLVWESIRIQEEIEATANLIKDLKSRGYKLYVLSNMSKEYIEFLRKREIYSLFDGDVVSCEEQTVKPEPRIFEIILERFDLDPKETLFIDDRPANLVAAEKHGINTHLFEKFRSEACCQDIRNRIY